VQPGRLTGQPLTGWSFSIHKRIEGGATFFLPV